MTLKDVIKADVHDVFLQEDDFAEVAVINGHTIPFICDDDRLRERTDVAAQGISLGERLIFVAVSDLPGKPAAGARVTIDRDVWYVASVTESIGMFEIRLTANRT